MNSDVDHLCGERVGSSKRVVVYVYKPDPRYVIKVPTKKENGHNKTEFLNGQTLIDAGLGDWIAPCRLEQGCIVMERTEPMTVDDLPESVPACLKVDATMDNFGLINGRPVMHDYHMLEMHKGKELVSLDTERNRQERIRRSLQE